MKYGALTICNLATNYRYLRSVNPALLYVKTYQLMLTNFCNVVIMTLPMRQFAPIYRRFMQEALYCSSRYMQPKCTLKM